MFQDIVIGPDIVDFVHQHGYNPKTIKGKNIINEINAMLVHEILCFDRENRLENIIFERVIELEDELALAWWEEMIDDQFTYKHIEGIDEPRVRNNIKIEDQLEASIAKKTKDKIWLKSKDSLKERLKFIRAITTAVKPISYDNYLYPDPRHKIIKNGRKWEFKRGDQFAFPKIYKPIFRRAKNVEIVDPYIVHHTYKSGVTNLEKIITYCPGNCKITIKTRSMAMRKDKDEFEDSQAVENWRYDLENKFQNQVKVYYEFASERQIKTNDATINLGHGLQAYNNNKVTMHTIPSVDLLEN